MFVAVVVAVLIIFMILAVVVAVSTALAAGAISVALARKAAITVLSKRRWRAMARAMVYSDCAEMRVFN
jgi:phage-related minor tail protein